MPDNTALLVCIWIYVASQVLLVVKNPPANAEDTRDAGSISELGRSPGARHGNPLQYSCLENPMDRETWRATVHRVTQNWTKLNMHTGSQRVGHD